MEIWVILSSATHATERNVSITSVELKKMLAQKWDGCLFGVVHNVDGQTGDIREKARKVQG
jgi:hypothetical protein